MYVKRTIEEAILRLGQSTTIQHIFGQKYTKVTLDGLDDRALAINNPKLFLETYGWPLIIDEIQKAPLNDFTLAFQVAAVLSSSDIMPN